MADPGSIWAWGRGSEGERELAQALDGVAGLRLLHDRSVPGSRASVDHIVIGPGGIFVVGAALDLGMISVRREAGLHAHDERLFIGRRDCSTMADAVLWQSSAVERALVKAGEDPLPPLTPVVLLVHTRWPRLRRPSSFRGVRLEDARSIRKLVAAPRVLDPVAIDRLQSVLGTALAARGHRGTRPERE